MHWYFLDSSICHHNHISIHPSFFPPCVLRYIPTHKYVQSIDWTIEISRFSYYYDHHATIPHSWLMWHYFVICIFICITIIINSFSWLICFLWFFLVNQCLHFKILHFIFNKFVWFQFVNINEQEIRFKVNECHW
jgi:hypothetical protein